MKDSRYRAVVLIGFNPVELARTSRLDTINMSFRDVAEVQIFSLYSKITMVFPCLSIRYTRQCQRARPPIQCA